MLKRNGKLCRHNVPEYSARLTDAEFLAYNTVFTFIEDEFRQFSMIRDASSEIEASLSRVLKLGTNQLEAPFEMLYGNDGTQWQIIKPLLKPGRSEILWCKRSLGGEMEFAVIERFDPNSPLAKARGTCDVQMTSNDARQLLQDFIEGQRQMLQLWVHDIVAQARENLEEKFSGQDLSRVLQAIAQRCTREEAPEETIISIQQRRRIEGVHV